MKGILVHVVVGLKFLTVIMENMAVVPQNLKMESRSDAAVGILVTQSKGYCIIALAVSALSCSLWQYPQ